MMAAYTDRLASAGFDDQVARIRGRVDAWPREYLPIVDREDDGVLERLQLVLDHALVVTSSVTPALVPMGWIADLKQDLTAIEDALIALDGLTENTITVPLVEALSTAVEETARELMQWPLQPVSGDWRDAVTQAASTYRRSLGQQLTQVVEEIREVEEGIALFRSSSVQADQEHRALIAERAAELDDKISELRASLDALDRQRSTVDDQLSKSIARADQAISNQQQQFSEAQEKRATEFRSVLEDLVEQAEVDFQTRREQADEYLAAIQAQVKESEDLVSVFAAAGTANAFSKEATEQAEAADNWRRGAIVLGILAGLGALSLFFGNADNPAWEVVLGKLALSVAFGGVATYAASQSSRHRRREETARHLELNIVAFGPFVRDLSEDKQIAAREKVVDAIFLRDIHPTTMGRDGADVTLSSDQVTLVGKILEQFRK